MACLTINADSDGIVEDESCGLLIGEKTTELFSLDTETGTARRVGSGGGGGSQGRFGREASGGNDGAPADKGQEDANQGREEREDPDGNWRWGSDNLLLQRDEYVVRALDAETSEELWFVTVAHFSALDLQGRGGATALTRAKVAARDREGYTRAVRARSASGDGDGPQEGVVKALPLPSSEDWGRETGAGGDGTGGGGQQARRRGKFGEEHADRFPYLLYENNAHVVAIDPMDGSVLWRKEMPALAVSLYGIRGHEWVDILPPPMSMLAPSAGYSQATTPLMPHGAGGLVRRRRQRGRWSPPADERRHRAGGDSCAAGAASAAALEDLSTAATAMVPAAMTGLLQPGLRQGRQLQAQLGFLNGHFYVSSSLRRAPLHAAVEDVALAAAQDRYPHPLGMASRRSFCSHKTRQARASGRDWRQKLLNGVEEALVEGRRGKNKVGVEMHPDNEGLFVSWYFLAALVGGVVAIVAVVACLAYKFGATAMANTAVLGDVPSGRLSPPAVEDSPALQHGASTPAMYVGSRLNGPPRMVAGDRLSLGPAGSPTAVLPQRSASLHDVHIQRVHSLPALGQSHSPPANADGRWRNPRQGFNALFGPAEAALANGDGGHAGKLTRAVSAAVNGGVPLQNGSAFSSAAPSPRLGNGPEASTPLTPFREGWGAAGEGGAAAGPSAATESSSRAQGRAPKAEGSSPSSAASGTSLSEASRREGSRRGSRKGRSDSSSAGQSRRSRDFSSSEEEREGGSGQTRRTLSEAAAAVAGRAGGRDRRASSRRASRSPRPSAGSTALDELVLGRGSHGGR
ncbi:unnamed protein product [Scytosiphon promiscuus]